MSVLTKMTAIANAVRSKTGESGTMNLDEIAEAINGITPQGSLQAKTVTPTGQDITVTPSSGYVGLSSVTVEGDENLVAANIKEDVTIYGVTGTHTGGGGLADKVPAAYATLAVAAEALLVLAGGSYETLLILENNDYVGIGFLTSSFAVVTYNSITTEYTASGYWYARYDKNAQTWMLYDHVSTPSSGSSFMNNAKFTNTTITFAGNAIFPMAAATLVNAEEVSY